ncbi:MAG: phosphotransferase, partial [Tenericutes bacterium HGW-Tenericutes-8]
MENLIITEAQKILKKDVKIVQRLLGGMSNYTYIIEAAGEKFTFRQPGENAFHFVDRDIEL